MPAKQRAKSWVDVADSEKATAAAELTPEVARYLALWERDPKSRVFAPLAEAFRKNGQLERAIEVCAHGLKIHPNYVSGRVALGRAYFDKGDYPAAKAQLEMVYEADPENLVAAKTLGEIYEAEGEIEKALLCYRLALYTTPSAAEIKNKIYSLQKTLKSGIMLPKSPKREQADAPAKDLTPLEAARKALRKSEARTAGDVYGIDVSEEERETREDLKAEIERLRRVPERFLSQKDEVSDAIDRFFAGAEKLRKSKSGVKTERKGTLIAQSVTELMLRQGYTQRAVKVYEEFLLSAPGNQQARNRVKELKRQLEEIEIEIRARQKQDKKEAEKETEDVEIFNSLTRWLNKVKG